MFGNLKIGVRWSKGFTLVAVISPMSAEGWPGVADFTWY